MDSEASMTDILAQQHLKRIKDIIKGVGDK